MRINSNVAALKAYGLLKTTSEALNNTVTKISSGTRINKAADDAAGLSISEHMRSQIMGMEQAYQNTQDGISMLQTAEGALGETQNILHRMRELSVQATNDTLTSEDRAFINLEIGELKDEINHIASSTHFNTKKLLSGAAGALWSSSDNDLKANLSGSLTSIDQFGQKINSDGNYNIEITADTGESQILKSNLLTTIIPKKVIHEIYVDETQDNVSLDKGTGWNFDDGVLNITGSGNFNIIGTDAENTVNRIVVKNGADANIFLNDVYIDLSAENDATKACAFYVEAGGKANVYLNGDNTLISGAGRAGMEVPDGAELIISSINGDGKTEGTLRAKGGGVGSANGGAGIGGSGLVGISATAGKITFKGGTIEAQGANYGSGIGGGHTGNGASGSAGAGGIIQIDGGHIIAAGGGYILTENGGEIKLSGGGCGIGNGTHGGAQSDLTDITITGGYVEAYAGPAVTGNAGIGSACHSYGTVNITIKSGLVASGQVAGHAGGNSSQDIGSGPTTSGLTVNVDTDADIETPAARPTPRLSETWIEAPATLREISQFYEGDGAFILEEPQAITINQGDGTSTRVMIYAEDTVEDLAKRINKAIAESPLNQKQYVNDATKFCTVSAGAENTPESILSKEPRIIQDGRTLYATYATLVVRSGVNGKSGELSFSGKQSLLNALGLNTIQEAKDSAYNITIKDAHTGKTVAENAKITGNKINGLIHENLEIEFNPMAGVKSVWNDTKKSYDLSAEVYKATLHLANTGLTFQTGANQGDEIAINIGDMSTSALGLDEVNTATIEGAARAIKLIDSASDKVIMQRSKVGAYIDAMTHTIENLSNETQHLIESESRIRDTDMAKETMNFIKMQILVQTGTSVLAQANQIPQSVLNLIGR